jgi:hypothetical protein
VAREFRRLRYERIRPELSAADVALRVLASHRVDLSAPDGFQRMFGAHARSTPSALWDAMPPPAPAAIARTRRGETDILGHTVSVGPGTDWHADPVFGVRWPARFVDAMPYLQRGSDLVLLWHLNKTSFLIDYAAAWRATGDPAFARAAWDILDDWCRANPWRVGANWISPMETGTRLVVWSQALAGLRDAPLPEENVARRVMQSIIRQADFVAEHFSQWALPNNHLINEAAAAYTFYAYWPELGDGPARMKQAEEILVEELERQVLKDGFGFECSVNYHLYVLDWLLVYLHACVVAGSQPAPAVVAAVERMARATVALISPGGRWPAIGDDSIDEFFALRPHDVQTDGDDIAFRGMLAPACARLLSGARWADDILAVTAPLTLSRHLDEAGITVARDADSHLVFVHGPQHRHLFANGHMHADAGSLELELNGSPVLIDSGTYLYTRDAAARRHFRGARAHNAPIVDGVEPMRPTAAFGWEAVATGDYLGSGTAGDTAAVGCRRRVRGDGNVPMVHTRAVVRAGDTVAIIDRLRPHDSAPAVRTEHAGTIYFHTPVMPGTAQLQGNRVRLTDASRFVRVLEASSDRPLRVDISDSADDPVTGYSTHYGSLRHGVTVRVAFEFDAVATVVTVIREPDVVVSVDTMAENAVECTIGDGHRRRIVRVQFEPFSVSVGGRVLAGRSPDPVAAVRASLAQKTDLDWLDELA